MSGTEDYPVVLVPGPLYDEMKREGASLVGYQRYHHKGKPYPYDEMRAILGLPDVREYVARQRFKAAARRLGEGLSEMGQALVAGFKKIGDSSRALEDFAHDYALASDGKD